MYLSTSSSDRDTAAVSSERKPLRAGLRVPPPCNQPSGVFVVVEMAVLVIVAALAMASIIVSSGGADDEVRAARATTQSRLQTAREGAPSVFAGPSTRMGDRAGASVAPR